MTILPDTIELIIAVVVGVVGKFGYDKGRSIVSNGKAGYLTREAHERECKLTLIPITSDLSRITKSLDTVVDKLDTLSTAAATAATAAVTSATAVTNTLTSLLIAKDLKHKE